MYHRSCFDTGQYIFLPLFLSVNFISSHRLFSRTVGVIKRSDLQEQSQKAKSKKKSTTAVCDVSDSMSLAGLLCQLHAPPVHLAIHLGGRVMTVLFTTSLFGPLAVSQSAGFPVLQAFCVIKQDCGVCMPQGKWRLTPMLSHKEFCRTTAWWRWTPIDRGPSFHRWLLPGDKQPVVVIVFFFSVFYSGRRKSHINWIYFVCFTLSESS